MMVYARFLSVQTWMQCSRGIHPQLIRTIPLSQMTYVPPSPPDHLSPAKHKNRCKDADLANGNDVVRVSN